MKKKTIITALLALVAMTGQSQTFTPAVELLQDFPDMAKFSPII